MKFKKLLFITALIGFFPFAASAKPTPCTILKTNNERLVGFIVQSNDKGIKFAYTENEANNGGGLGVAHSQIKAIDLTDEGEIMGPGRNFYSRSNWTEAEAAFRQVAEDYDNIWGISREKRGNFACEARFFQIECLRRLGRYGEIKSAMDTNTGKALADTIAEVHLPKLKFYQMWQEVAGEEWAKLEASLNEFEVALAGKKAELIKTPSFDNRQPTSVVVQLAYMRGKLHESKGDVENALRDYYRVTTLDFGTDANLSKAALNNILRLQSKDKEAMEKNYFLQTEIHAAALVTQNVYGAGEIEGSFRQFLKEPEMPEAMKKAKAAAEAEKKAAEAAAPTAKVEAPATPVTPPPSAPAAKAKAPPKKPMSAKAKARAKRMAAEKAKAKAKAK